MSMYTSDTRCAHCDVEIVDPTSRIIAGGQAYCCPNCAHVMQVTGSGSDPQTLSHEGDLRCAHCSVPIVNDTSIEMRGDQVFCCRNCAYAVAA